MDISEDPPSPSPQGRSRSKSPPPPEVDSDEEEAEMEQIRAADERTRYLRQKKRLEQIAAYRMRELRDDREARVAKRNNLLSPRKSKGGKGCLKKVKFDV